jgi:Single-stranded DNA-binding replication protein A (RPA), large (70 kD) subunit and related ssDNA-binding proteins
MSFEDVLDKVVEETEASEQDIRDEVEDKMDEFEGLVSEEGAVHLVAKEYGVQVENPEDSDLSIENVVPEMRKLDLKARVLNVSDVTEFERDGENEDGKVQNIILGDDTGTVDLSLWDEQTEIAEKIEQGDPIRISGAYTIEDDQGDPEIRLGDSAQVAMADEDEVPEVESNSPSSDASEVQIGEVSTENANYTVSGMLVAMYSNNPFYTVDPETGDTAREDDDGVYTTDEGKTVEDPDHRLAISGVVDDGSGTVRTVFFGDQARKVLDVSEEEERQGDQEAVEEAAQQCLGKQLRAEGRTRYNDYFDQIEMVINDVEEIEPEQEMDRLVDILEA